MKRSHKAANFFIGFSICMGMLAMFAGGAYISMRVLNVADFEEVKGRWDQVTTLVAELTSEESLRSLGIDLDIFSNNNSEEGFAGKADNASQNIGVMQADSNVHTDQAAKADKSEHISQVKIAPDAAKEQEGASAASTELTNNIPGVPASSGTGKVMADESGMVEVAQATDIPAGSAVISEAEHGTYQPACPVHDDFYELVELSRNTVLSSGGVDEEIQPEEEIPEYTKNGVLSRADFSDCLFVGDSRTEGLFLNTGLTDATFYATRGLTIDNIYNKQFVKLANGSKVTVLDALKEKSFKKIYIMLGVNELGWVDKVFKTRYAQLVEDLKAVAPDSELVIESILPVTESKSKSNNIYTNDRIVAFNDYIKEMCDEEGVEYADLTAALVDEDGVLPEDASSDGIHFYKSYYVKWINYMVENEI